VAQVSQARRLEQPPMGLAAIALLGALLTPQELTAQTAGALTPTDAPFASLALDAQALSSITAGEGTVSMSVQTLTGSVDHVSFSGGADLQAAIRSGDINMSRDDASGMSGVQTVSLSTGFGSSVQAATSIAASGLVFNSKN
jgi:hypothetical protein